MLTQLVCVEAGQTHLATSFSKYRLKIEKAHCNIKRTAQKYEKATFIVGEILIN
jgi:hypothetical protein